MTDTSRPLLTFAMVTRGASSDDLGATIGTLVAQTDSRWELLAVDEDGSAPFGSDDPRVRRTVSSGPLAADMLADTLAAAAGDLYAVLDPGDLLLEDAVATVLEAAAPDVDLLYTDELVLGDGPTSGVFRKPVWSPERLRGQLYTGRLTVLRTEAARTAGGFDAALDGAHEHDLVLRVTEAGGPVVRVPSVLCHRPPRHQTEHEQAQGVRAVQAHFDRIALGAHVSVGASSGTYVLRRTLDPLTTVSVVIPTRGSSGFVWGDRRCFVVEAVRSLLAHTRHGALEIVVVHDSVTPPEVLDELREIAGGRLVLREFSGAFNFSEKCNLGYLASSGSVVVMLNDDVEVVSDDFVEQLVAPLAEPTVGMTGAYLMFPDQTVQHAGHTYHDGIMSHGYLGTPDTSPGEHGALLVNRETSGLTAACVALRRGVFESIGGFSEQLPVNFNDVDLSLKVRALGYRNVWLQNVRAFHFESRTRQRLVHEWELDLVYARWDVRHEDLYMPGID